MKIRIPALLALVWLFLIPIGQVQANAIILENSVTQTGINALQGQFLFYTLEVPANSQNLRIQMDVNNGDPDLYVRYSNPPTETNYTCRPYNGANTSEICTFAAPQAGTWHIMLHAYSQFSNTFLTASYEAAGSGSGTNDVLENGVAETGINASQGQFLFYTVEVPANSQNLRIQMDVGNGDPDLYVKYANPPTETSYACRPYHAANTSEICTFPAPQAGTWHIMLHGYTNFTGIALIASYEAAGSDPDPDPGNNGILENGVAQTGINALQGQFLFYTLEVPANSQNLQVQMDVSNGDADLYVRYSNPPTEANYACRPYVGGNISETCTFPTPQAGTWHIMLHAYSNFTGTALTASYEAAGSGSGSEISILPLGNSITQAASNTQSYRYRLWKKLIDAGIDFDYVGSLNTNLNGNNPAWPNYRGQAFDRDHEGHWGWFADQIMVNIDDWLQGYTPDIVLIHLGTNDSLANQNVGSTINELRSIILSLQQSNPQVTILLAQIIPSALDSNAEIPRLNSRIPALAAEMNTATSSVVVVDQSSGFDLSQNTYDGIHPNVSGEEKMAQKWFDSILSNLPNN